LKQLMQTTEAEGFAGDKARLSQALLRLRHAAPAFFDSATCRITRDGDGAITLTRQTGARQLTLRCDPSGDPVVTWEDSPAPDADSGKSD
ncbi:MAG: DUF3459 domain-containing protein, partial [Alphaproteobacteria bacterium]|nr:DUF3459 domain-containing protein [Alphaproteobacteria bacterium]